ncbi:unnamed protein product [Arctogadus glacialis]
MMVASQAVSSDQCRSKWIPDHVELRACEMPHPSSSLQPLRPQRQRQLRYTNPYTPASRLRKHGPPQPALIVYRAL